MYQFHDTIGFITIITGKAFACPSTLYGKRKAHSNPKPKSTSDPKHQSDPKPKPILSLTVK